MDEGTTIASLTCNEKFFNGYFVNKESCRTVLPNCTDFDFTQFEILYVGLNKYYHRCPDSAVGQSSFKNEHYFPIFPIGSP